MPKKQPEDLQTQARRYLIKAKLYRFMAICLAIVGLVVFFFQYMEHVEGKLATIISSPQLVLIFLLPFLPAAVLSWLSMRAYNKSYDALEKDLGQKE